jgi:hypothetical protein
MTSIFEQERNVMTSANNIGEGWHNLVRGLETQLNEIDPDFILQQVKEKFGGLRYYAHSHVPDPGFQQAINVAEAASFHICEVCGEEGECKATDNWLKTLCETHRAEDIKRHEDLKKKSL